MLEIRELFLDGGRVFNDKRFHVTDTKTPYFSWAAVSDTDGDSQTAFDASVFCGKTELWHTGWTESAKQGVLYAGKTLPSGRNLDFTLKIRNTKGEESELFGTRFICGEIKEWKGKWITADVENDRAAIDFRRDFKLEKSVAEACLFVCGIGYHKVTVNGSPIDDACMDPAFSDYTKTCYYAVIDDIEEYLEVGENVIGITAANGWRKNRCEPITKANHGDPAFFGMPEINAMLMIWYTDGTKACLSTDEKWVWKFDAVTDTHIYNGETYDASLSDPLWDQPGERDDTDWNAAVITEGPGGKLRPMALEPIRERETYNPVSVTEPERGTYIVDFGQNIAGVVNLFLPEKMKRGQKITVRYAEELDENGFLDTAPLRSALQTDTYIASGDDRDLAVFTPQFTYHGFRYAEIRGIPLFDQHTIRAAARYTDIKNDSSFRCGSPIANAIQKMVIQTEKSNLHSIMTDCPQRDERMAWMNDATVRFEETPFNFDIGRMFTKVIRDIMDEQREDGAIPSCAPFVSWGEAPADPVCSSFLIAGRQLYEHIGNKEILREAFDAFAKWEEYLLSRSENYIVSYSCYGDWAGPAYACNDGGSQSAVTDGLLMSAGYSYYNCILLSRFAEILGREEEKVRYTELSQKIREAFLTEWYHTDTHKVGSGSQGAQAFALWLGILPREERQLAAEVLHKELTENGYRITTGNLCTLYLLCTLSDHGYTDDAWNIITREEYPSIGHMHQHEATTVWERFECKKDPGMNSHNHPMYASVGAWFYTHLCGIRPTGEGFTRVSVSPVYPEGLLSAQAVVETVLGQLSVRYVKRYGKTELYVSVPFGMTADVNTGKDTVVCQSGFHHFTVN